MPSYFGLWKQNMNIQPPASPAEQLAQAKAFEVLITAQTKAGIVKDVGGFVEGNAGCFTRADLPDEQIAEALAMGSPYFTFELHRTIPILKFNELLIGALQKRSGQK